MQSCSRSEYHLDHLFNSLFQSLNETYKRILCNINHSLIKDARRILTLFCFTLKSLTVRKIINEVVVEINKFKRLNYKRRLQNFNDVREICISLIDIDFNVNHKIIVELSVT